MGFHDFRRTFGDAGQEFPALDVGDISYLSKRQVLDYFHNLDKEDPTQFQEMWKAIAYNSFSPQESSAILNDIASHVNRGKFSPSDFDVRDYLQANIAVWQNKLISKKGTFNKLNALASEDLIKTMRAFATLGVEPSAEFFKAWESAILPRVTNLKKGQYIEATEALRNLDTITSRHGSVYEQAYTAIRAASLMIPKGDTPLPQRIWGTQARHTDLWFSGESRIKSDKKLGGNIGKYEQSLCDLFVEAGYEAELYKHDNDKLIPDLPQALDIKVYDPKTSQTIYLELDGDGHLQNVRDVSGLLKLNVKTQQRSSLTHRMAPDLTVLRMCPDVKDDISGLDKEARIRKCREIFDTAVSADPGVYRVTRNNKMLEPVTAKSVGGWSIPQLQKAA